MKTSTLYKKYSLPTYGPPSLILEKGEGSYVWDENGKRYLDFGTGIAVTALGHSHPRWVKRVQKQAATLTHVSNLYGTRNQGELARALVQRAGAGKVFFSNSGAETNEALIKLARLYGCQKAGGKEGHIFRIVCAKNAFHGRTMGGLSATPKPKVQKGFAPLLEGFDFAELNQIDSFAREIGPQTAAVMIETIQGEGGIHPADPGFLKELRALCSEKEILLILDEVQCGIGRTGKTFAYQHTAIQPDALGMAKGLGGGFPIGAVWVSQEYAELFTPGSHGTTFGGNPLACAAALATLDTLEKEDLLEKVTKRSQKLLDRIRSLAKNYPDLILEVRGLGYMIGVSLTIPASCILEACRQEGLLVLSAGEKVLRLLPPLTLKNKEMDQGLDILESVFANLEPPQ